MHRTSFSHDPWPATAFVSLLAAGSTGFIAEIENRPAGLILLQIAADEAEILTFAVAPQYRRRGIGAALLQKTGEDLRDSGIQRLMLEVGENNRDAIRLYQSLGFVRFGERAGYYRHGNNIEHAILMEKSLIPPVI
jgi:ribosomal-protein-alanine N-acetyltransferase